MPNNQKLVNAKLNIPFDRHAAYQALCDSQFVPYFQPIVSLRSGKVSCFEVLARWHHPTKGLVGPDHFIALAEQDEWIGALSNQIYKKAFSAASKLPCSTGLAINVSPYQLRNRRLPKQLQNVASKTGFSLSRLTVEITESALIADLRGASTIVSDLKAIGCKLALDDFGTGYSSLHHLQSLSFDELKVDREFVSTMTEKRQSRKIVAAVVGLGQSLGMTTVAEGIETEEQAEMMLWLGCDYGQGYLYQEPIPSESLSIAIESRHKSSNIQQTGSWRTILPSSSDIAPAQRLAQLQAVYDGAPVGLAFVDRDLRCMSMNKKLADMSGKPMECHLGRFVSEIVPELYRDLEPYLMRALAGNAVSDVETKHPVTGETRLLSYQPALDEAGEVIGIAVAVLDITERRRLEDALNDREAQYRDLAELNSHVLWRKSREGTHGVIPTENESKDVSGQRFDNTSSSDKISPVFVLGQPQKETSVHQNQSVRGHFGGEEAERRRQVLLDMDILDTPAEAEFQNLVTLAAEICATPISLVSLIDTERQWFKASVGLAPRETPIGSSFCAHAIQQDGLFLVNDATKDERFKQNPLVIGHPHIRFYAGVPLYASDKIAVGTLCVIDTEPRTLTPQQITALEILSQQVQAQFELRSERKKLMRAITENEHLTTELTHNNQILAYANTQLERLATTDSLTGLLNRHAFERSMQAEFERALRMQYPLAVLLMDIDDFKKRNDQFGHQAGDDALRKVGEVVQGILGTNDMAARIGGEEFVILLRQATLDDATVVARRVQDILRSEASPLPQITLSIGSASLDGTIKDWETLLSRADTAMYKAKQAGKDRVFSYLHQDVA